MGGEISEEFMAEDGCPPDRCCDDCAQMYMARELRAYRESGALEALRSVVREGEEHKSRLVKVRAAIAALEAIASAAVDESKGMKS